MFARVLKITGNTNPFIWGLGSMILVWAEYTAYGGAYLVIYSAIEFLRLPLFHEWTEFLRPVSRAIVQWLPGVLDIVSQVKFLGYERRVPYVEHVFAFTFIYSLLLVPLNLFYRRTIVENARQLLGSKSVVKQGLFVVMGIVVWLAYLWWLFAHGWSIEDRRFSPHVKNSFLMLYAFDSILFSQMFVYFSAVLFFAPLLLLSGWKSTNFDEPVWRPTWISPAGNVRDIFSYYFYNRYDSIQKYKFY